MSRSIFITCGTSIFNAGCWNFKDIKSLTESPAGKLQDQAVKNEEKLRKIMVDDELGKKTAEAFKVEMWNSLDYLRDLPAELASFRVYVETLARNNERLNENDKIWLIHSTNNSGNYCYHVLEKVIHKITDPQNKDVQTTENFQKVPINHIPIPDLDPREGEKFLRALGELREQCRERLQEANNAREEIILNLTGGYKAMLIALTELCTSNNIPINILYRHETTEGNDIIINARDHEGNWTNGVAGSSTGYLKIESSRRPARGPI